MDDFSASGLLYLVATAFFILGIKRLSKVKTARSGNQLSAIGMLIAVVVTLVSPEGGVNLDMKTTLIGIAIGGGIGGFCWSVPIILYYFAHGFLRGQTTESLRSAGTTRATPDDSS